MIKEATMIASSKLTEKALGFITVITLTHMFAPVEMGKFFFYFSLISLLLPLMDFGLKKLYVVKAKELDKSDKRMMMGTMLIAKLSCGIVVLLSALSIEMLLHYSQPSILAVTLCFVCIFMEEVAQLFRSNDHLNEVYSVEVAAPVINKLGCLLTIIILKNHIKDIESALLVYCAFCSLGACVSSISLRGTWPIFSKGHIAKQSKSIIKEGFPYSITGLFVMISFYVDSVILGYFSFAETGTYNAAFRIVIVFGFLSAGLSHVLFTRLSKNQQGFAASLNKLTPFLLTIFTSIAIGVFSLSEGLIDLVYSDEYGEAASIIAILAPFILFSALSNVFAHSLEALGKQKEVMRLNSYTSLFNLVANLIFIPFWGMYAAAVTTVLTELANTILSYKAIRKEDENLKIRISPFLCCFITSMLVAGYFASQLHLLAGVMLGALIFFPLLLIQTRLQNEHKEESVKCVS